MLQQIVETYSNILKYGHELKQCKYIDMIAM